MAGSDANVSEINLTRKNEEIRNMKYINLDKNELAKSVDVKKAGDIGRRYLFHKRFESLDELLSTSEYLIADGGFTDSEDSWVFANSSKKETAKLLWSGDSKDSLIEMIDKIREEIEIQGAYDLVGANKSCTRRRRFVVDGGLCDVNRVLSGEPECFETTKRDGKKEYVSIGVNASMSCAHGEDKFARCTAIAYVTAEILESLGYGVEIVLLSSTSDNAKNSRFLYEKYKKDIKKNGDTAVNVSGSQFGVSAVAKSTNSPVDIRNMSATALTGFLRRHMFAIKYELFGKAGGCCTKTSQCMLNHIGIDIMVSSQFEDDGSEYDFVMKAIKDFQK